MTDTTPTNPGDVYVVGQRRRADGTFPSAGGSGGGSGHGGVNQNELDPEAPGPDAPHESPCEDPEKRKIWDADARAVSAVSDLRAKASSLGDGSTLSTREFGANLYLNSFGRVELSDVSVGPTPYPGSIPEVTIQPGGATYLNWMGDIHNHPSGDARPSSNEWNRFVDRIDAIQNIHPQRTEIANVSMYIVVVDAQTGQAVVHAYKKDDDPEITGPDVNPNAQSCQPL